MLGVLNCFMDKIDRVGENKTQRLYRCYDRSFAKDQYRPSILIFGKGPMEADELGRTWVLPCP